MLFQPRTWYSSVGTGLPEGVARTEDHGVTWQQVWAETPVAQVAISPNFDQDETLFGVLPYGAQISNTNFILSHDAGETWHPGGGGLCSAYWLAQLTISPGFARDRTLLLSSDRSSLFMSEDAGLTWRAIFPPGGPFCNYDTGYELIDAVFSPDYPDDPTIYAATYQGLYASYDAGRSWTLLVGNSSSNLSVRRAPSAGRSHIERTTYGDVRSTVDGHRVFLPLATVQGSGPPYKPQMLFMRATIPGSYGGAHYRSDDGGRTWQCMTPPEVRTRAYLPLLRIRS
ncbi:MAG TPA: sialidase family protein [Anaerolineae bacterium]|nr:sialidase family protein [Anaerolineae bacterium]